jgi:hypothetical protein
MSNQPMITIAGSYRKHLDRILACKHEFEQRGAMILRPHTDVVASESDEMVRLEGDPHEARLVHFAQLDAIRRSDVLYVVNPGGYVGASATGEVGYARACGILVVTMEPAFEDWVASMAADVGDSERAIATWHKQQARS